MVAIRDMEMPSCCAECNLEFVHDNILGCCVYQGFDDENKDRYNKRLPNCPLQDIKQLEDCVSRQAVLDKAELIELEDGQTFYCIDPEDVKALPPVTPTFPKGATNGDVMLAIFKEIQHYSDGKICADWWNAPYNGVENE